MASKRAATARTMSRPGSNNAVPGAQAISTALGYNQLLATNSVSLMAEKGDQIHCRAAAQSGCSERRDARGPGAEALVALRRMVEFCRSVPDEWSEHEKLAATPAGLGIHALNLDLDIGPLLQAQKLLELNPVRPRQWYQPLIERRRAGDDELHRRRQRVGHDRDAARHSHPGADVQFFSTPRLRTQPNCQSS